MPRVLLSRAFICLDCEIIYDQDDGLNCPQCASRITWPVGKWIAPINLLNGYIQNLNTANAALAANKTKEVVKYGSAGN